MTTSSGGADAVGRGYLDHLTDADRRLLAAVAGDHVSTAEPSRILGLLDRADVFAAVFAARGGATRRDQLLIASPFLTFAVALHRTAADLRTSPHVPEWIGPRQRLPVFSGSDLTGFLADPRLRLFLAELLASYAHVASGSYWTRTARGWRRRRWSELDPVRLAELVDVVPVAERSGVYRRLGDLALFLTGVFPDHTAERGLGQLDARRLLRGVGSEPAERGAIELLEHLGARWYRLAAARAIVPTDRVRILDEVAGSFGAARRILNLVADRYLFPAGNPWFSAPGSP